MVPARSSAQTSLDGFGARAVDHLASLGDSGFPVDFGGRVSFDVVPAVQVFGEFGRIGNVMPPLVDTGLAFTRFDLTASAFYGEGGVRLLAAPRSAVSPYVEGTAGVAHLRFGARGLGSTTDAIVRAALNLVDTRDPLFGVGGGMLMRAGPLQYRSGLSLQAHRGQQRAELRARALARNCSRTRSGLGLACDSDLLQEIE